MIKIGVTTMNDSTTFSSFLSKNSSDADAKVWDLIPPERSALTRLKRISLRNRTWFSLLNWKQRRFIDAVIMTVDKIRSPLVLKILAPMVRRLLTTISRDNRSEALILMGEKAYGMMRSVAENIIRTAQNWGNKLSNNWLNREFIKYLIIMNLPRNKNLPLCSFQQETMSIWN